MHKGKLHSGVCNGMVMDNKGDKSKVNKDGTLQSQFYIDANEMHEKLNATSKSL